MDAGITAAKQLGLTPGIALTAEQTARLASDIVWLEPQMVEAGKIDFVGATLRNRAAGGQTIIRSEGDISLGTVETAKRESHGSESDKNHRIVRQQA
ncbi:hypothetical protein EGS38_10120 [Neisseria chenwenguii]|nr:hypothetical protein [Neisseria chenwenguii]ROV55392.1 hypothetical protein EGS38_10120 [Neisseria chenwenguii]